MFIFMPHSFSATQTTVFSIILFFSLYFSMNDWRNVRSIVYFLHAACYLVGSPLSFSISFLGLPPPIPEKQCCPTRTQTNAQIEIIFGNGIFMAVMVELTPVDAYIYIVHLHNNHPWMCVCSISTTMPCGLCVLYDNCVPFGWILYIFFYSTLICPVHRSATARL